MINNLKILFITYTHSGGGGAEAVLTTLVNHLSKDWQIDILETLDISRKKEMINEDINLFPALTRYPYKIIDRLIRYVFFLRPDVIKALRKLQGYDIVVSWMYRDPSFMLPSFPECKKIAWFHGMVEDLLPNCSPATLEYHTKKRLFKLQKKACICADKIIEISNKTKQSVLRILPEFSNKVEVIYNGVDIERILYLSEQKIKDPNTEKTYKQLLSTGAPILISMGGLDRNKNFPLALNALSILKKKNVFAYYLIIGKSNTYEREQLEYLIDSLNLNDRVFFIGFQQNGLPFLKQAKLLLITSFEEGFPTVATEAMTLGIPFVTTQVGGSSDELADNERCGLVSEWDAEEYAEKIETLLKNDELYKKMSNSCKDHIKKFSVDSSIKSFYRIVETIPKKSVNLKKMNRICALVLFVAYSLGYYIDKFDTFIKISCFAFKNKMSVLNACKLCFSSLFFLVALLFLPLISLLFIYLIIRYKSRLFAHE